jgi:hypothetical protein
MNNLGSCYLSEGYLGRARQIWTACDNGFAGARIQARVATLHNLSLAAHYSGRYDDAIRLSALAAELEGQSAPRPARLTLIHVRQSWMWGCRGLAPQAMQSLKRAKESAASARLSTWESICNAHDGKIALVAGQPERARVLLMRGIHDCSAAADPWDVLDLRLWLLWARLADQDGAAAIIDVLPDLVAVSMRSCRHEQSRVLEAAAAWLVRRGRFDDARRAWLQAEVLRRIQGIRRFPFEHAQGRRTQLALRSRFGRTWKVSAQNALRAGCDDLAWLVQVSG